MLKLKKRLGLSWKLSISGVIAFSLFIFVILDVRGKNIDFDLIESKKDKRQQLLSVKESPRTQIDFVQKAQDLADGGAVEKARALLEAGLEKDRRSAHALIELALIEIFNYRSPMKAIPYLERAFAINRSAEALLFEIQAIFLDGNNLEKGDQFFKTLMKRLPDNQLTKTLYAEILLKQGKFQDSQNIIKKLESDSSIVDKILLRLKISLLKISLQLAANDFSLVQRKSLAKQLLSFEQSLRTKNSLCVERQYYCIDIADKLEQTQLVAARFLVNNHAFRDAENILYHLSARIPKDAEVISLLNLVKRKLSDKYAG